MTLNSIFSRGLTALACSLLPGLAFAAGTPLPSDPRIVSGRLDNGMTWMFRRHNNPPGKLAMQLHIRTGSLNEVENQRGVAHFLEHMVFNGTEHFPPGKLVPYFESIGMTFGGDLNASTGFDRTMYVLYLPSTDPEQLDKALLVLSDQAFRATLDSKEIDNERGVILEEMRGRKSASQRIRDQLWPELFVGSRLAERLPIGIEEVITKAPRERFVEYYRTWYRPELMTLLMVGDCDHEPIVPVIEKWFADYKPELPPGRPGPAGLKAFDSQRAMVVTDPEVTTCSVQLISLLPGRPPTTTVEQLRGDVVEILGTQILNRRLDELIRSGKASFRSAGTSVSSFYQEALSVGAMASGEPADWEKMLTQVITEVNRACRHGFADRELELARRQIMALQERSVRVEPTVNAKAILQEMFNSVHDREPVLSAQQQLDIVRELMPTISLNEITVAFRANFDGRNWAYVLTVPKKPEVQVPTREAVLAAARQAWSGEVQATASRAAAQELLPSLPSPGKITGSNEAKDLGILQARLSNGIRVHYRFMDYKKDSLSVAISFAGGGLEEKPGNMGITSAAGLVLSRPATSRLSSTDIRDLRMGRNISLGGGPSGDDSFVVSVGGSPQDLEFGLQLAYAVITDGRIEQPAFDNFRQSALRQIEANQTSVSFHAGKILGGLLSGGDPRRMPVTAEDVKALSVPAAQAWFERLVKAPAEVAVVGDMPWEQVRPLLERYVGSLPARPADAGYLEPLRKLNPSPGPMAAHLQVPTVTPKAVAYAGFVAAPASEILERRALSLAENVIQSRLIQEVREAKGLVYSISASYSPSWVYRQGGAFQAGSSCKPENAREVADAVHTIFAEFAKSGPTPEELENARKQVLNALDTGMKEPSYWMNLLTSFDLHQRSLDEARTQAQQYKELTAEQLVSAFRKYYVPEAQFTVTAIPVAPPSGPASAPAAEPADSTSAPR